MAEKEPIDIEKQKKLAVEGLKYSHRAKCFLEAKKEEDTKAFLNSIHYDCYWNTCISCKHAPKYNNLELYCSLLKKTVDEQMTCDYYEHFYR